MEEEVEQEIVVPENDEGDSLSSDEEESGQVFLGFAVEENEASEEAEFPSTVGGRPFWPRSVAPLSGRVEELMCVSCKESMPLLCQVYAPLDAIANAHHRFLSVFVCTRAACWRTKKCVLALRSQLRQEETPVSPAAIADLLCCVCGKPAFKACGKCRLRHYCSQGHQALDWKAGHKACCGKEESEPMREFDGLVVLHRMVIESEEEHYEFDKESVLEMANANSALVSLDTRSKLAPLTPEQMKLMENSNKADNTFLKFQHRIRNDQEQVLRYSFGSKPLWVNSDGQMIGPPPNCPLCGGKRVFEFQLMPQLLYFLKVDMREETAMDWSSLVVYSCENSCEPIDGYALEYVFVH
jgi:pre-rRNA-processing protein TSR4